jgi:glycosyltransferase involved in cell wall biosynthesis
MLDACLDSAAAIDPSPREVIVTIDGADAAVIEAANQRGFRVVSSPAAPGVSATRNAGVAAATGEIIVLADSDVLLPKGHIAHTNNHAQYSPIGIFPSALVFKYSADEKSFFSK